MLNSLLVVLNIAPLITLFFFVNTINLITLWYLAGIYLITTGLYLLFDDADIFIGFLWVIDLGVGLIFFIFILHFSTFLYAKSNIDKQGRLLNNSLILLVILLNITFVLAEPASNQSFVFKNSNWVFYVNWYDFYELFFSQTVTDLNLLKEMYFYQNSVEFVIINFVLLYGILATIVLSFLIKQTFTVLNFSQFKNFKLKSKTSSLFFLRNQNFLKQQNALSGTRVWVKKKSPKNIKD
jgi:hypothetical protein